MSNPYILATPHPKIESLNQAIQEMHGVLEFAKQCMQSAEERSKFYTDHERSLRECEVVYVSMTHDKFWEENNYFVLE